MIFGRVFNLSDIDFTLPKDPSDTGLFLGKMKDENLSEIYVDYVKWITGDL